MNLEHTTVTQNRAHRTDLTWIKVGPSEYMRGDGVSIRKVAGRNWWRIYLPSGELAQTPNHQMATGYLNEPAGGPSLSYAKCWAEDVTASSPSYDG